MVLSFFPIEGQYKHRSFGALNQAPRSIDEGQLEVTHVQANLGNPVCSYQIICTPKHSLNGKSAMCLSKSIPSTNLLILYMIVYTIIKV